MIEQRQMYDHLASLVRTGEYALERPETKYHLKLEGMKFASRNLGLESIAQEELNTLLGRFVCLSQAIMEFKIPAYYANQMLEGLPEQQRNARPIYAKFVDKWKQFGDLSPLKTQPGPFDPSQNGIYLELVNDELEAIKKLAEDIMTSIIQKIGNDDFIQLMAAGNIASDFLSTIPSPSGNLTH